MRLPCHKLEAPTSLRQAARRVYTLHGLGESLPKGRNRKEAVLRLFGQGTQDYFVDIGRNVRVVGTGWLRLYVQMLIHHLSETAMEGWTSGQKFVGHDGKGVLVRCWNGMAFTLFRSHVRWSASNRLTGI